MVEQLLNKYRKNIVMLDGILQWALNPTSESAGYGFEKNYSLIMKNLKITHELSLSEVEEVIKELFVDRVVIVIFIFLDDGNNECDILGRRFATVLITGTASSSTLDVFWEHGERSESDGAHGCINLSNSGTTVKEGGVMLACYSSRRLDKTS